MYIEFIGYDFKLSSNKWDILESEVQTLHLRENGNIMENQWICCGNFKMQQKICLWPQIPKSSASILCIIYQFMNMIIVPNPQCLCVPQFKNRCSSSFMYCATESKMLNFLFHLISFCIKTLHFSLVFMPSLLPSTCWICTLKCGVSITKLLQICSAQRPFIWVSLYL